jgi:hypothetical protein
MQFDLGRQRCAQDFEQRAALHAEARQASVEIGIAHVHHYPPACILAVQAMHRRAASARRIEQSQRPQGRHPGGLQQEAGTDWPGLRCLLEHPHAMAVARQRNGQRLTRSAVTDDGDVANVHASMLGNL